MTDASSHQATSRKDAYLFAREVIKDVAPFFKMNAKEITLRALPTLAALAFMNAEIAITTFVASAGWKLKSVEEEMHKETFPQKYKGPFADEQKRLRQRMTVAAVALTASSYALAPALFGPANPGGLSSENDRIIKAAELSIVERSKDAKPEDLLGKPYTIVAEGKSLLVTVSEADVPMVAAKTGAAAVDVTANVRFDYANFFQTRFTADRPNHRDLPLAFRLNR